MSKFIYSQSDNDSQINLFIDMNEIVCVKFIEYKGNNKGGISGSIRIVFKNNPNNEDIPFINSSCAKKVYLELIDKLKEFYKIK